jgi:hypothetical protein
MASLRHATDELLVQFVAGALTDASAEKVRAHVKACADCRCRLAGLSNKAPIGRAIEEKPATRFPPTSIKRSAWPAAILGAVLGLMGITGWVAATLDSRATETSLSTAQKDDILTPPATAAGAATQSAAAPVMADTAPNIARAVDVPKPQDSAPRPTI